MVKGKSAPRCDPGFDHLCYREELEEAKELLDGLLIGGGFRVEKPRHNDAGPRIFIDLVSSEQVIRPAVDVCSE